MVDVNFPSMVNLDDLNSESVYVKNLKNNLSTIRFPESQDGKYLEWLDEVEKNKNYSNFMALTTAPQNNPFGISGNKAAMKNLELQKPARTPTDNNPFMNVPLTAYDIPQRYSRSEPECGQKCKKNFYKSLFRSPDDALWNRSASERQFYTAPNTSVPNEQTKYAMWLYGNNQVGKSGSIYDRYGYPYTPDSLVNTGVNAASPQNAGQVETNYGTPEVYGSSPWVNNVNYGYGFGGIPGGIPYSNNVMASPTMSTQPMSYFPQYPNPVPRKNFSIPTPRTSKVNGIPKNFHKR